MKVLRFAGCCIENRSSRFPRNIGRWMDDFIRKNWDDKFNVKNDDEIYFVVKLYEYVS